MYFTPGVCLIYEYFFIVGPEVWQMMKRVTDMLGPLLLLCRLADGQKPVISKLYGTQLHVRNRMELLARDTDDDSVEKKILSVLANKKKFQSGKDTSHSGETKGYFVSPCRATCFNT